MKISGSILAVNSNYMEYANQLKYAHIDYLHVDIFQKDNNFKIEELLNFDSKMLPLDVHLIFEDISDEVIEILNKSNVTFVNIQYENLANKEDIKLLSKKIQAKLGLAITTKTDLAIIEENIDHIEQILFMCSQPGISGAKFDDTNYERIKKIHDKYPSLFLIADGGINSEIAEKMGKHGVSMIVSGSYLCSDLAKLGEKTYYLKYLNEQNVKVTRNMITLNSLPIIDEKASFIETVDCMNKYRLGAVFIANKNILKGIIVDGDIRRAFLKYGREIFDVTASGIMNKDPFKVDSNMNMDELYQLLHTAKKGISIIPIIEEGEFVGAIDLHLGL